MKLIIAGSRDFDDKELLLKSISEFRNKHSISEIVSGTAKGADSLGSEYGLKNNITIREFPAEWDLYGNSAGMKRNKQMAVYSNFLIAFWNGYSKGTENMINEMKKLKKPYKVVYYNDTEKEW